MCKRTNNKEFIYILNCPRKKLFTKSGGIENPLRHISGPQHFQQITKTPKHSTEENHYLTETFFSIPACLNMSSSTEVVDL